MVARASAAARCFGRVAWPGRVFYDVDLIADNFLTRSNDEPAESRAAIVRFTVSGVDMTVPRLGVSLAFEVKNLTDDQTRTRLGFPLPGRSVFFTVSYGFGARRGGVASSEVRTRAARDDANRCTVPKAPRARGPAGGARERTPFDIDVATHRG